MKLMVECKKILDVRNNFCVNHLVNSTPVTLIEIQNRKSWRNKSIIWQGNDMMQKKSAITYDLIMNFWFFLQEIFDKLRFSEMKLMAEIKKINKTEVTNFESWMKNKISEV